MPQVEYLESETESGLRETETEGQRDRQRGRETETEGQRDRGTDREAERQREG